MSAKDATHGMTRRLVVQTYIVYHKREEQPKHYEIQLAETDELRERRDVFITTDEAVYNLAHSIEGYPIRCDVLYTRGQKWDGKPAQVIIHLTCVQKRVERQKAVAV